MNNIPGTKVIEEIKNGNEKVLTKIYEKVYHHIEKYCRMVGINDAEAPEAVQDAFEVLYRQILTNKFQLTSKVETYLVSVAKKILLSNERKRLKTNNDELTTTDDLVDEDEINEIKIREKKHELFMHEFNKLGEDCKQVLGYTLKGYSVRQIAELMKYSSEAFTKTKRARCRKYLIDRIKTNPWYEKLKESTPEDFELSIWRNDQIAEE